METTFNVEFPRVNSTYLGSAPRPETRGRGSMFVELWSQSHPPASQRPPRG